MTQQTSPLRAAFVGGGSMARAHARALRQIGIDVQVAGVYDADAAVAGEFFAVTGARAFATLEEMLAELRPNVVHVCTTAGTHFQPAREAILAGAHVYVEKPFVESLSEARTLLALASAQGRMVCAGHQLLGDPAFETLLERSRSLQPLVRAESELLFRSPTLRPDSPRRARIAQLLDVLPHPLYSLVAALESMAPGCDIGCTGVSARDSSIDALLQAGPVSGRLHVSLDARPVASTLAISGANGALTADFIRGCVTGIRNPGSSPIEKIVNPVIAGCGAALRSTTGVARRLAGHAEYPGLARLLRRFYLAASSGQRSPLDHDHLLRVVRLYEELGEAIRASVPTELAIDAPRPARRTAIASFHRAAEAAPVVAVTGASGFLGRALVRKLHERGLRVRGIGRGADPGDPNIHEWIRADLSREVDPRIFAGVDCVVHAAAATSGGFEVHRRHSIESARHVVSAMAAAGVRRLVHVSSISVVRPPRSLSEVQDERTPRAEDSQSLGPYTWGKCESEELIVERAAAARIAVCVIRPGALTDRQSPEIPGLVGKRLYGGWHLGLGRPSLPIAVCDVELAADAIAFCAANLESVPPVINLMDPEIATRRELLRRMRADGWTGRMVWVPISLLSAGVSAASWTIARARGGRSAGLSVWQVLRPRRFDASASARLFARMRESGPEARAAGRHVAAEAPLAAVGGGSRG